MTALHTAAWTMASLEVCKLLITKAPTLVQQTTKYGFTALHYAAVQGHLAICKLLIQKEPTLVQQTNKYGATALHKAARGGHVDVCKLLIEKDRLLANYFVTGGYQKGYNAYQLAVKEGHKATAAFLKPYTKDTKDTPSKETTPKRTEKSWLSSWLG